MLIEFENAVDQDATDCERAEGSETIDPSKPCR
jgi:hypothetical protein